MRSPGLLLIALVGSALSSAIAVSAGRHIALKAVDRAARGLVARAAAHPRLRDALRVALFRKRALDPCSPDQWTVSFNATAPVSPPVAGSWRLAHEWAGAMWFEGWDWVRLRLKFSLTPLSSPMRTCVAMP